MIEMQWSKIKFSNIKKDMTQLLKSISVGGVPHVLQFREVRTVTNGSTLDGGVQYTEEVATDWQDVEVAKEQPC